MLFDKYYFSKGKYVWNSHENIVYLRLSVIKILIRFKRNLQPCPKR